MTGSTMSETQTRRFVRRCEQMAGLYDAFYLDRIQEACPGFEEDPWASLRFFLYGYAFERGPTSPEYAAAAVDAIDACRDQPIGAESGQIVWQEFLDRLEGRGPNHRSNPLCPKGTKYTENRRCEDDAESTSKPMLDSVAWTPIPGGSNKENQ